ncbi:zinc ribbon domain-containing protein [Kovacikia minuta CCNUW1]|uniref:FmdB family zinc ribbon protein n=1 Tax=Kovacikia minuta TaxID=2931930 RepID=UPI001CCE9B5F|nr:zinc ribbon domain-containing protein [Kovacikia minuta]UBF26272.1 zinc ribbon domain-containing protein [Kovacikia minuta CCNUW1]
MPLYEFKCDDCGLFEQWRTMAESGNPASCPECQKAAKRIFSAPALLSGSLRLKQENREPQLVQRSAPREPERPKVKSHTGGRPWMISH